MEYEHIHDDYIREHYLSISDRAMEKVINRSRCYIKGRMKKMGIAVPEEIKQQRLINTKFKHGSEPKNKGVKMTPEAYERASRSFFKKGQTPHNTMYDGHERLTKDGYVLVRVEKGRYELKHRIIWEAANGKVPNGMMVMFKDKNKQNLDLSNLILVSKTENAIRNNMHDIPEEIIPTLVLLNQLKKKIQKNEKQTNRP